MSGSRESRQGKLIALVIAGAMILWIGGQWAMSRAGVQTSYRILLDLSAAAAFIWALVATWRLWRHMKGPNGRE